MIPLSGGREIIIETGKLAKQADGSVVVKQGNTDAVGHGYGGQRGKGRLRLHAAVGRIQRKICGLRPFPRRIPKREARPSDYEILVSRLIDRALRPLFPSDFHAGSIRYGDADLCR